jgi:hypothetical protein
MAMEMGGLLGWRGSHLLAATGPPNSKIDSEASGHDEASEVVLRVTTKQLNGNCKLSGETQ